MQIGNDLLQEYVSGLNDEELRLPNCRSCKQYHFPPRIFCPYCHHGDFTWKAVDPAGTVFTFTTVFGMGGSDPFIVLVEVFPGVRILGRLAGPVDHDAAIIGREVRGEIIRQDSGEMLLQWSLTG